MGKGSSTKSEGIAAHLPDIVVGTSTDDNPGPGQVRFKA
jgi:hypothetical protein